MTRFKSYKKNAEKAGPQVNEKKVSSSAQSQKKRNTDQGFGCQISPRTKFGSNYGYGMVNGQVSAP